MKHHRVGSSPLVWFPLFLLLFTAQANASEQTKILILGDSLSAAYRLPVESGWAAMLAEHFKKRSLDVTVTNASISGATSAAGLKILPSALVEHKPDIVILGLGANDGLQGKPLGYIKKNLARLIEMSQTSGAKVMLLGIRIPPNYGSAYAEPFFQQYAQLSAEFETALVPFMLDGVATDATLMMDDGKHPNKAGQLKVFEIILPHIDELVDAVHPSQGI